MPYADKEAQRAYQREWVKRRREEYFADKKCLYCGSSQNLQLDHIDPTTKVSHRIWSWSAARREAELEKCQVLCLDCHQAKSLEDLPVTAGVVPHRCGTKSQYSKRGCRCRSCTDAAVASTQRWRDSKK